MEHQGFKYFQVLLRGREELLLAVSTMPHNEDKHGLSSHRLISPLDEDLEKMKNRIVFLIAGYARYRCPYVWLRTQQDSFLDNDSEAGETADNPLHLKSTMDWKVKDIALWEIVWELISMVTETTISNPFKVDFAYLDRLPEKERILCSGALLSFLQQIWIQSEPSLPFIDEVYQDIATLHNKHMTLLYSEAKSITQ
ncbi:uncharacterized protein BYT42DRAFT_545746 [Radiomyces spectabilis]|uniref:uncharacterized protein n=1 Tax=Radiomyces spectabilis TaxID=64574 RepID=UPI00222062D6|nr:uncharacterized protein BYT42DRAFT_545746 [Radiomyces spectabilis]KAI8379383.1 hypothetical protein BYT42DRAFT_545746 [Radiomyces spectabilis]